PWGPVMAIDPSSGRRDTIIDANVAWASYADGMLAWTLQDGVLYGAAFDLGKRRLTGPGSPLGGTVLSILGFVPPAAFASGGLAYAPTRPRALVQVTRSGVATTLLGTDRPYHIPRVSPDGRRLSLDFTDQVRDVWLFDIADSTLTRFGFDSIAHDAEWLPDGSGLIFAAVRGSAVRGGRAVVRIGRYALHHSERRDAQVTDPSDRLAAALADRYRIEQALGQVRRPRVSHRHSHRPTQPAKFFCCIVRPGSSVGRAADILGDSARTDVYAPWHGPPGWYW
ncbi:MAG: hypothetical protein ACREMR_08730, partial [Gemmatimonadales bacterium]